MAQLPNFNTNFWFVAFSIFSVLVQSHCILNFYEQCLSEIGIAENSNATQIILHVDDQKLKCIDACILKKIGMMKNGKIDGEISFNILKKSIRGSLSNLKLKTNICAAKANEATNECEAGNIMRKCLSDES